jgi:hypothetical protein
LSLTGDANVPLKKLKYSIYTTYYSLHPSISAFLEFGEQTSVNNELKVKVKI